MTDHEHPRAEQEPLDTDVAAIPAAAPPGPTAVGRRSFVRSMAGESVTTAGRLAGISGMVTGSVFAAVRAAGDGFGALGGPKVAAGAPAPAFKPIPAPRPLPAAAGPITPPRISDADRATIEMLSVGLLATNQPGAAPAVGVVRFRFDGEAFRIPGRSATARTSNLQRDPFASLALVDPDTGDAILIAGRARIVYGSDGRDGAAAVLDACGITLAEGWDAADSRGEPVLVVLEPQRLFRRGPDERA